MKYFFDTEFNFTSDKLSLISIGIISEKDVGYYAITDFEEKDLQITDFVKEQVIPHLGLGPRKPIKVIAEEILDFLGNDRNPEFYAYFGSYDWVLLGNIFGPFETRPKIIPYYCKDFKQICDHFGINDEGLMIRKEEEVARYSKDSILVPHNAFFDAIVLKKAFEEVCTYNLPCNNFVL